MFYLYQLHLLFSRLSLSLAPPQLIFQLSHLLFMLPPQRLNFLLQIIFLTNCFQQLAPDFLHLVKVIGLLVLLLPEHLDNLILALSEPGLESLSDKGQFLMSFGDFLYLLRGVKL